MVLLMLWIVHMLGKVTASSRGRWGSVWHYSQTLGFSTCLLPKVLTESQAALPQHGRTLTSYVSVVLYDPVVLIPQTKQGLE